MYNIRVVYVEISEIRKDVKVNGKRASREQILSLGDRVDIYITEEKLAELRTKSASKEVSRSFKKDFTTVYEDENIIAVNKPFGLLTHGDGVEKKNHLANQVVDDLILLGEFNPKTSKGFTPAPANRLDRNTTGIVLFGKNAKALRDLNRRIRRRDGIRKFYLTIAVGELGERLELSDALIKDEEKNRVRVLKGSSAGGDKDESHVRDIVTVAEPISVAKGYSLIKVELVTGRSHQIRAHLASAGYPLAGDPKYGDARVNEDLNKTLGLKGQLLHAWEIEFSDLEDSPLNYMSGQTVRAELPKRFSDTVRELFGDNNILEIKK